jgi:hypothetical protein
MKNSSARDILFIAVLKMANALFPSARNMIRELVLLQNKARRLMFEVSNQLGR